MEAILRDPVAIRSAEFWTDCRVVMDEGEVLGKQTGAVLVAMEWINALKVMRRVSCCWPQEVEEVGKIRNAGGAQMLKVEDG